MYRDKLSQEAVKANRMYGDKVRATLYRDGNWLGISSFNNELFFIQFSISDCLDEVQSVKCSLPSSNY